MDNRQIYKFALKWLEIYQDPKTTNRDVEENFAEDCFTIGFEMDCGDSLEEAYPGKNLLNDHKQFITFVKKINDVKLLGTAIFSKWRGVTHWSYEDSLLSDSNHPWFIAAFQRLAFLTNDDVVNPYVLKGKAKRIRIVSNNKGYGYLPELDEEVEQRLTMTSDGRVWFSAYSIAKPYDFEHYNRSRRLQFKLEKEKADIIFSAFNQLFCSETDRIFATDIGSWDMRIIEEDDRVFPLSGSLCVNYDINGMDLSDLLRKEIGIDNLFAFNGNSYQYIKNS